MGGVNEDALRQVLIHKGFLSAFRSIQPAVLQTLSMLLASDTNDGDKKKEIAWTVHITGHSLGGALASLTTFDLARIAQGYFLDDAYSSISRGDNDRSFFETLFDLIKPSNAISGAFILGPLISSDFKTTFFLSPS